MDIEAEILIGDAAETARVDEFVATGLYSEFMIGEVRELLRRGFPARAALEVYAHVLEDAGRERLRVMCDSWAVMSRRNLDLRAAVGALLPSETLAGRMFRDALAPDWCTVPRSTRAALVVTLNQCDLDLIGGIMRNQLLAMLYQDAKMPDDTFEVSVRTFAGKIYGFSFAVLYARVGSLKHAICNDHDIPLDAQLLIYKGQHLTNDAALFSEYGVCSGAVLMLVVRRPLQAREPQTTAPAPAPVHEGAPIVAAPVLVLAEPLPEAPEAPPVECNGEDKDSETESAAKRARPDDDEEDEVLESGVITQEDNDSDGVVLLAAADDDDDDTSSEDDNTSDSSFVPTTPAPKRTSTDDDAGTTKRPERSCKRQASVQAPAEPAEPAEPAAETTSIAPQPSASWAPSPPHTPPRAAVSFELPPLTNAANDLWCMILRSHISSPITMRAGATISDVMRENPQISKEAVCALILHTNEANRHARRELMYYCVTACPELFSHRPRIQKPLHYAAALTNDEDGILKMLLESKGSAEYVNERDHEGNTPLHVACVDANLDAVMLLCQAGARIDARNARGLRPIDRLFVKRTDTQRLTAVIRHFHQVRRRELHGFSLDINESIPYRTGLRTSLLGYVIATEMPNRALVLSALMSGLDCNTNIVCNGLACGAHAFVRDRVKDKDEMELIISVVELYCKMSGHLVQERPACAVVTDSMRAALSDEPMFRELDRTLSKIQSTNDNANLPFVAYGTLLVARGLNFSMSLHALRCSLDLKRNNKKHTPFFLTEFLWGTKPHMNFWFEKALAHGVNVNSQISYVSIMRCPQPLADYVRKRGYKYGGYYETFNYPYNQLIRARIQGLMKHGLAFDAIKRLIDDAVEYVRACHPRKLTDAFSACKDDPEMFAMFLRMCMLRAILQEKRNPRLSRVAMQAALRRPSAIDSVHKYVHPLLVRRILESNPAFFCDPPPKDCLQLAVQPVRFMHKEPHACVATMVVMLMLAYGLNPNQCDCPAPPKIAFYDISKLIKKACDIWSDKPWETVRNDIHALVRETEKETGLQVTFPSHK